MNLHNQYGGRNSSKIYYSCSNSLIIDVFPNWAAGVNRFHGYYNCKLRPYNFFFLFALVSVYAVISRITDALLSKEFHTVVLLKVSPLFVSASSFEKKNYSKKLRKV